MQPALAVAAVSKLAGLSRVACLPLVIDGGRQCVGGKKLSIHRRADDKAWWDGQSGVHHCVEIGSFSASEGQRQVRGVKG